MFELFRRWRCNTHTQLIAFLSISVEVAGWATAGWRTNGRTDKGMVCWCCSVISQNLLNSNKFPIVLNLVCCLQTNGLVWMFCNKKRKDAMDHQYPIIRDVIRFVVFYRFSFASYYRAKCWYSQYHTRTEQYLWSTHSCWSLVAGIPKHTAERRLIS